MSVPPKIKNFLWKICQDGLHTKDRLQSDKCVSNALYDLLLACLGPPYFPFFPLSPYFYLLFHSLDHSDILLDFQSSLIEFLAHMLSPCFLVFLLQV